MTLKVWHVVTRGFTITFLDQDSMLEYLDGSELERIVLESEVTEAQYGLLSEWQGATS